VGQETLDEGCECVEEVKVSWGVWLSATMGTKIMEGGKVLLLHDLQGLGKCGVGIPHSHERLKASKGN
jgi:hypothetical protein